MQEKEFILFILFIFFILEILGKLLLESSKLLLYILELELLSIFE